MSLNPSGSYPDDTTKLTSYLDYDCFTNFKTIQTTSVSSNSASSSSMCDNTKVDYNHGKTSYTNANFPDEIAVFIDRASLPTYIFLVTSTDGAKAV